MSSKVIITTVCIISYHFILNLVRFFRTKHLLNEYDKWIQDNNWELVQHKDEVKKLFKHANVSDAQVPYAEPAGYGQIMTAATSVHANFPSMRQDIATLLLTMFHNSIGVYRKRMFNSFNPLYWTEMVINLPKNIFIFLNISPEKGIVKIFQIFYWFSGIVIAFFLTFYNAETISTVKNFINKLVG